MSGAPTRRQLALRRRGANRARRRGQVPGRAAQKPELLPGTCEACEGWGVLGRGFTRCGACAGTGWPAAEGRTA